MVAATEFPHAALYQRHAHDMFLRLGLEIAGFKYVGDKMNHRRFRSVFGVRPDACAMAWNDLLQFTPNMPDGAHPCHLFWFLIFARQYPTEHQLAGQVRSTEGTVRFWVWFFGMAIRDLKPRMVRAICQLLLFSFSLSLSLILLAHARVSVWLVPPEHSDCFWEL